MLKPFLKSLTLAVLAALAVTLAPTAFAQIVSSNITGTIRGSDGKAVAGATVTAVHTPTNARFTTVANDAGRYTFRSLPVGGPYTISAESTGFGASEVTGISTELGNDVEVPVTLRSEVLELEKFVTTGSTTDLDASATGTGSFLTSERLEAKPTAQRSLADLISASPLVTLRTTIGDREESQISAVGQNNRYNSIMIDGARINDQFGLNMTGLASFFNPLSIDTLEQLSVQVAPYDVRQAGFTGATVNAVTKSGTNQFHGTAYYIFGGDELMGQQMLGEDVIDRFVLGRKVVPKSERTTYGFTLGGPLWKNRLFFFLNYEKFELVAPPGNPGLIAVNDAQMTAFVNRFKQYNTDAGTTIPWGESMVGESVGSSVSDEKRLAKVDWKINDDHRLAVRYSTTDGELPQYGKYQGGVFVPTGLTPPLPAVGGSTALSTHPYSQARKEEVWAAQLFSTWTPDFTTEIKYSSVKQDQNTPLNVIAPEVTVFNLSGVNTNGQSVNTAAYVAGTEFSRQGNEIYVDSQNAAITGDYVYKNFVFSGGAEREESKYYNIFRNGSYGSIAFRNLDDFLADRPLYIDRVVYDPTKRPDLADISDFATTGFFGQVKWDTNARLTIYGGVRYEFSETGAPPPFNAKFLADTGYNNTGTLDGVDAISPRVGFNYALREDRSMQLRGGVGHFVGRAPWVIFSNSYNNPGIGTFNTTFRPPANGTLAQGAFTEYLRNFDVDNPYGSGTDLGAARQIDWVDDGIELPSLWRGNVAIDKKLEALGATLTVELVHSVNDATLFIRNENLLPITAPSLDGRKRFGGTPTGLVGNTNSRFVGYTNLYHVSNARVGKSTYAYVMIDRPMRDKWAYNGSYSHGSASDAQAFGQTTASGQWQRNVVFNQNEVEEGTSDFEVKHRIQFSLARQFEFVRNWKTTASLYYEARSGAPYSWVYSSDINGDSQVANDAVAVPSGADDPRFNFSNMSGAQRDAYLAFFQASGLSKYAGGVAPKNAFNTPWVNRLDLKFSQKIPIYKPAVLEVFLDFINFGAFVSEDFFGGYVVNANQAHFGSQMFRTNRLGPASYDATGRILPQQATPTGPVVALAPDQLVFEEGQSRWRIQVGARLRF